MEGCGDTMDLVVIGGAQWISKMTGKFGKYLLACYDDENEEYQVITKLNLFKCLNLDVQKVLTWLPFGQYCRALVRNFSFLKNCQ